MCDCIHIDITGQLGAVSSPVLGGFQGSSSDHQGLLDGSLYLLSYVCPAPPPNTDGPFQGTCVSCLSVCPAGGIAPTLNGARELRG